MKKKVSVRKSSLMTAVILGSLAMMAVPAFAADATEEEDNLGRFDLDQIVITATRTPVEAFKANANINVVTAKDIEMNHPRDMSEALRMVPGVYIGNYNIGGGYDNSNNFYINGSDEVVVLVDGVKINNASNKIAVTQLKNLDNVERIEVLKGSASTLYGSAAKGGVINIITKKPDKIQTKILVNGGSYEARNYSLHHNGRQSGWFWDAYVSKNQMGDFKDAHKTLSPAYLNATNLSFKLGKELSDKHELLATYDSYKADYKYAAPYQYHVEGKEPYTGEVDNNSYKIILNSKFDDTCSNQLSFVNLNNDSRYNKSLSTTRTIRVSDQFNKNFGDKHLLTAGFEWTKDKVISFNGVKMYNRAFYLQDQYNITKQLKLTAGVRYDNNSGFGRHTTPSVNIGYNFNDKTNIYASYSDYFIPPSPMHLYHARYGNPNTKAETGNTKEIGINHRFDNSFVATAHLFWRSSKDRIGYIGSIGKYGNVGDEKAHGWDIQFRKRFNDNWSAFVGYTHTSVGATDQRARNVDGYVPRGSWNVGVDYTKGNFDASLTGKGIIDRVGPQTADAMPRFFPATTYWVWDLALNYKISNAFKAYLKVNNILNKFYAEHSNARMNWYDGFDPNEQWWTAPGRNFIVGVEYTF